MKFFGIMRADLRRMLLSKRFWLSWAAVTLLLLCNVWPEARAFDYHVSLYYLISARGGMGAFLVAMTVITVLPFGFCHKEDIRNNYVHSLQVRSGVVLLGWSHIIVTAIGAFAVVFLGYAACLGILALRMPIILGEEVEMLREYVANTPFVGYDSLMASGHSFLYFVSVFATEAMGYAFLAVFALMVSAKVKNAFLVLSAPIMLYYGSLLFSSIAELPGIFSWFNILNHGGYFAARITDGKLVLFAAIAYFASLICIEGLVFTSWLERRR